MTHRPPPATPSPYPLPATPELLALAAKARPDWQHGALRDALAHAHYQGMTWGQTLTAVARLLADPEAEPADLVPAREPWRHRRPAQGPETAHRGAAAARAALHTDTDTTDSGR
ncbi:hypothetical protein [Streptomyces sp. NPDC091212]|uniref:hypothetical protein n=1 Tax=Streptomyces sp. NPDC091212 TaxID=3155191 RepID=UPI003431DB17